VVHPGVLLWAQAFPPQPWEVRRVAIGTKHGVIAPKTLVVRKKGVDILPHHLAHGGNLEEPSGHAFTDQGIAVRQALCAADEGAKKLPSRFGFVAPDDGVRRGLDFKHTGARRGVYGMPAVIKQEYVAVGEEMRVVLVSKLLATPLPAKGAAVPVNDHHSVEETKAGEHVAIGQHCTGVGVRPLMPPIEGTDSIGFYIQVLIAMPFPDDALIRRDLPEVIAPDVALVLCAQLATFDV
jgi:hypothetical protein